MKIIPLPAINEVYPFVPYLPVDVKGFSKIKMALIKYLKRDDVDNKSLTIKEFVKNLKKYRLGYFDIDDIFLGKFRNEYFAIINGNHRILAIKCKSILKQKFIHAHVNIYRSKKKDILNAKEKLMENCPSSINVGMKNETIHRIQHQNKPL